MPKAQKLGATRKTRPVMDTFTIRKKEDGRPKGTLKKYKFDETKLGFMLKHETPLIYGLIMQSVPETTPFPQPSIELIETITKSSRDPSFHKAKYKRYLEEYREHGIFVGRAKKLTPKLALYYSSIRKKKLEEFKKCNRLLINKLKTKNRINKERN